MASDKSRVWHPAPSASLEILGIGTPVAIKVQYAQVSTAVAKVEIMLAYI